MPTTKQILMPVGLGGANRPDDVALVQFLLNCVPAEDGGPLEELAIDGLVGPKTLGAIQHFQEFHFGKTDRRVDPENRGGSTIVLLNAFDPLPDLPAPNPGASKSSKGFNLQQFGKGGAKGKAQKESLLLEQDSPGAKAGGKSSSSSDPFHPFSGGKGGFLGRGKTGGKKGGF